MTSYIARQRHVQKYKSETAFADGDAQQQLYEI